VYLEGDDAEEVNKEIPGLTGESCDNAAAAEHCNVKKHNIAREQQRIVHSAHVLRR
jgi:hypothetical protein